MKNEESNRSTRNKILLYKCRYCGDSLKVVIPEDLQVQYLPVFLYSLHICNEFTSGIADLVGIQKTEEGKFNGNDSN